MAIVAALIMCQLLLNFCTFLWFGVMSVLTVSKNFITEINLCCFFTNYISVINPRILPVTDFLYIKENLTVIHFSSIFHLFKLLKGM